MPVGPYPTFDACVTAQKKKGYSDEVARKVCGKIEKNMKKQQNNADTISHQFYFSAVPDTYDEQTKTSKVEILRTGNWNGSKGVFAITAKTLRDFAASFKKKIYGSDLQVNFSHNRWGEAAGWMKDVALNEEKDRLLATVEWTPVGLDALKKKIYRYFSSEIAFDYQDEETQEKHKNVLMGGALTNIPYIRGLAPVMFSDGLEIEFTNENDMSKKGYNRFDEEPEEKGADDEGADEGAEDETPEADEGEGTDDAGEGSSDDAVGDENGDEALAETKKCLACKKDMAADAKKCPTCGKEMPMKKEMSDDKTFTLAEVRSMVNEAVKGTQSQLSKMEADLRRRDAHTKCEEFALTDNGEIALGFTQNDLSEVEDFAVSLSDAQARKFFAILKKAKAVDFHEYGVGSEGEIIKDDPRFADGEFPVDEKSAKLDRLAKAFAEKNKVSYAEAMLAVEDQV